MVEDNNIKIIRFISLLEISLDLVDSFLKKGVRLDSSPFLSVIDDIRYKSLLLYEYILSQKNYVSIKKVEKLVVVFSCSYYKLINSDFDLEIELIKNKIDESIQLYKDFLITFVAENDIINTNFEIKTYKEADHPKHVWIFLNELSEYKDINIQIILGIRFGGIEIPYLVKDIIFINSDVDQIKISSYTDKISELKLNKHSVSSKNILIVDDNILTGRTLSRLIDEVRTMSPRNIYFACISYSGMKRYSQMIMNGHGIVNPEVLKHCCTIMQSEFTRISSSKSYKNKNGVFDKIKKEIQKSLDNYNSFLFKI